VPLLQRILGTIQQASIMHDKQKTDSETKLPLMYSLCPKIVDTLAMMNLNKCLSRPITKVSTILGLRE